MISSQTIRLDSQALKIKEHMTVRDKLKGMVWNLAYVSGLLGLLEGIKKTPDHRGLIFYYHRVHPHPGWDPLGLNIFPSLFYRQVKLLKKKIPLISLKEYIQEDGHSPRGFSRIPRGVITFDDGYRDCWVYAWPILRDFSVSPTFFVCTDPLFKKRPLIYDRLIPFVQREGGKDRMIKGLKGPDQLFRMGTPRERAFFVQEATRFLMTSSGPDQEIFLKQFVIPPEEEFANSPPMDLYLSAEEVKKAQSEGIDIGSHTASHPNLSRLPREKWEEEIKGSKEELEILLGSTVNFFSYPAGEYTGEIAAYVREVGYLRALTTGKKAVLGSIVDSYALPRISPEGITSLGKFYALVVGIRPDWFK
jgi:peptidoglycan/xylan/chitin deacetylase (PgdA/CDA1 family)